MVLKKIRPISLTGKEIVVAPADVFQSVAASQG